MEIPRNPRFRARRLRAARLVLPLVSSVCIAGFAPGASGQTLVQDPLVRGQFATLDVSGATPLGFVFFLAGFTGTGAGPCLPPGDACLGLQFPVYSIGTQQTSAAGEASRTILVPANLPLVPMYTQGLGVYVGPQGQLLYETTNTITAPIQPISALGDPFDGVALDASWQVQLGEACEILVGSGELSMRPLQSGGAFTWFNDGEGPYVYKEVTGDFEVTGVVRAEDSLNPGQAPPAPYRLGGFLVRNPLDTAPGTHDFVHVAVGGGDAIAPIAVEEKNTVDSVSNFSLTPIAQAAAELRLRRTGATIELSYREIGGGTWLPLASYPHPELPPTVHIGMMAYSNPAPPQVTVRFEGITFGP